ncbi:Gfo/Idh/MocA family protein [Candidatus Latescibacterota bacterium]
MGYRIGLVGCGGIAGAWVEAVAQHEDCQIALTYDLDPEAANSRAVASGARAVANLADVLGAGDIDLVVLGTPQATHPELTEQAAAAGKHVLSEKPMALSLDGCQRMIDACTKAGVKLAIGHTLRFWSAFLKMRELVAEGVIGVPVAGSIDRMGAGGVRRAGAGSSTGHWREQVKNSGGSLLEGYVHEIDFTRSIFGDPASAVCQIGGGREFDGLLSPHIVQAVVEFESGAVVTMRTGSTVALPTRGYWVSGTKGGMRFDEWGGPVQLYLPDRDGPEEIACDPARAYYLELCDLLQAIETGGEPENDGLNGKKNVGLALAMYRSTETGKRISFDRGIPTEVAEDYMNTTMA